MLRLSLKSTSQVHEHGDGSLTIVLFVDRWEWLIPLVSSYGPGCRHRAASWPSMTPPRPRARRRQPGSPMTIPA